MTAAHVDTAHADPARAIAVQDTDVVAVEPEVAVVEQDLLVEDVSIDGMCGVY